MPKKKHNKKKGFWPKDERYLRDNYIKMLHDSDLFDDATVMELVEYRFGKRISKSMYYHILKKTDENN